MQTGQIHLSWPREIQKRQLKKWQLANCNWYVTCRTPTYPDYTAQVASLVTLYSNPKHSLFVYPGKRSVQQWKTSIATTLKPCGEKRFFVKPNANTANFTIFKHGRWLVVSHALCTSLWFTAKTGSSFKSCFIPCLVVLCKKAVHFAWMGYVSFLKFSVLSSLSRLSTMEVPGIFRLFWRHQITITSKNQCDVLWHWLWVKGIRNLVA